MPSTKSEATEPRFAVMPIEIAFEGVRLPDGRLMSIELKEPRRKWAVFGRESNGDVGIVATYDNESDAEADRLALESALGAGGRTH